jgi:hypothetical protein
MTELVAAGEPLVLVGPPAHLQGQFQVRNLGDRRLVVRQPRLRGAQKTARGARAAAPGLTGQVLALPRVIVRAGQTRPVAVDLSLNPATPPGVYEAVLEIDGHERPVVLHVTEHVAFSMQPDELVVPNRPGQKVHKRVVFTNEGNVPLAVRTIGTVVLDDELAHCRALRGALADVGETMENLDAFVKALGRRYRTVYDTLALKVQNERVTLAPGDTRAVDLHIGLPEKLDARSRYTGYAAVSTGTLTFTVVPD